MFHVIEKEMRWRKDNGRPEGFDALKRSKPVIAVGADEPLGGEHAEPPNTITLIAIGPLTTLATAAAHFPRTFLRAKSVIVMGGAIAAPGNMTPVGEFNTIADAVAAARIYALTSPEPESTMPPFGSATALPDYPSNEELGERRLRVVKFPLDITTRHSLRRGEVHAKIKPLTERGSPLAEWVMAFTDHSFMKMESLHHGETEVSLHDPVCIWYAIATEGGEEREGWEFVKGEDIRVETIGQWTRGMCVVDRRDRKKALEGEEKVDGDMGEWLSWKKGNRIDRCVKTPGERVLAGLLLDTVFGK
ncbi:MAG: hypothetical protein Q9213_005154 [Squamulea squamosa]